MNEKEMTKMVTELAKKVDELTKIVEEMKAKKGPVSAREMTIEDAERIINGDLAEASHKKCAEILGLSYGQVYSARGGYTFKSVVKIKK
jgi:hypothetical protein